MHLLSSQSVQAWGIKFRQKGQTGTQPFIDMWQGWGVPMQGLFPGDLGPDVSQNETRGAVCQVADPEEHPWQI